MSVGWDGLRTFESQLLLEQTTDQLHSRWIRCFFTATLTPATTPCGSALSPFGPHTTEEINEQKQTLHMSFSSHVLRKPSKADLASTVKVSHLGSSHRSGAELNSFDNTLGIKLLKYYHSLINEIKSDAQVQEASTCRSFSSLTPVEGLLHYNEHFYLAQQDCFCPPQA